MRLKLDIAYNGAEYAGWQRQLNARSVQQVLEEAIEKVLGYNVVTTAAGRTDAGVHARAMPISLEVGELRVPLDKLAKAINSNLPYSIRVIDTKSVDDTFNSRFDAKCRSYEYILLTRRDVFRIHTAGYVYYSLDFSKLEQAAEAFLGKHDFTTFSKNNPDTKNPVCHISESRWEKISDTEFRYHVTADRFIYGMVRSLVGSMIDMARGKRSKEDILTSLDLKDRRYNSPLAPAEGLYFVGAGY